jgi:hypothetical protein
MKMRGDWVRGNAVKDLKRIWMQLPIKILGL